MEKAVESFSSARGIEPSFSSVCIQHSKFSFYSINRPTHFFLIPHCSHLDEGFNLDSLEL